MAKTAIITGGARGMGLATAKVLGRDHRVVLADLTKAALDESVVQLKAAGIEASGVVCDITDRTAVDELFHRASSVGDVRAVVHAAGLSPSMGEADLLIRVNALGTLNITRASLAIARSGFALVNVASIAGYMLPTFMAPKRTYKLALTDPERFTEKLITTACRGPKRMHAGSAYSISKNFVIWYSAEQATAFGARNARILSISPGSFDTPMGRLEEDKGSGELTRYCALKRFGRVEEIAAVLAFCVSEAPGYLTGTDILVDGGTKAGIDLRGMIRMARSS